MILAVLPVLSNGQNPGFKTRHKIPAGSTKPDLNFRHSGTIQLKSASPFRYSTGEVLSFPGFKGTDRPRVIRRGNSPIYIERKSTPLKSATVSTSEERFFSFLEECKEITRVNDPRKSFKVSGIHTDNLGITHIKAMQHYKGIEIYGSESILHIDTQKERFTGSFCIMQQDIPVTPRTNIAMALQKTKDDLKRVTVYRELTPKEKKFLQYESPEYSLVIFNKGEMEYTLTWVVTIRPNFIEEWKYFIDASSGEILRKFNNTNNDGPMTGTGYDLNNVIRTFDVYLDQGTYYMYNSSEDMYNPDTEEGVILTLNANNTSATDLNYSYITSADNTWNNPTAISAHYHASLTYNYFNTTFGRNSINGQGGNIISFVNVSEDDGSQMENAFWNGQAIFLGNGGDNFKPFAGALDVIAHELGHGVVSNSANLEYYGQSGAMNESYADIFGSMVDREDWKVGEDVTKTSFSPSGALRDMENPHNGGDNTKPYWQPAHMSEIYLGTQDNGGVHRNSGIGNHAYYLYATAITKNKAENVFYRALTEYLTTTSQFTDWRIAVIQSAMDLFGASSQEAVKAAEAFDAVGIRDESPVDDTEDVETNPGLDYLLSYDTSDSDPATLYTSSVTATNFVALSTTEMKGKVSVTDDGTAGVFVAPDDKIKIITLNASNPEEDYLSDEAFFDNVAVSKDGQRLAAISIEEDATIYVYDFNSETWQAFTLYNPTTSDDNYDAGGVLYADAIEFDITGEYLIYDAINILNSNSVEDIYYWDIGFIRVWDNSTNDFGDGSILKLFSSLPENVSVGNPVFSKNSPFIIAFDYFYNDGVDKEYGIFGANLETGDLELITSNLTLGYPSYSKTDTKIAFSAISTEENEIVATIDLAGDKITPAGEANALINYAKWPVYYATGNRTLGLAPVANFTADYKTGSAPLHVRFVDQSSNGPTSWLWTFQGGTPSTSALQNPEIAYNAVGTYKVTLKATNSIGDNTISKEAYIVVSDATGINDDKTKPALFYPNPVKNILNITCDREFSARIYNLQGDLLLTSKNKTRLDLSVMKSGIYILEIETGNIVFRNKLVKE